MKWEVNVGAERPWTWRKLMWPLAIGLTATSLLGLECQVEPVPDRRYGFENDECIDGNKCQSGLICVQEDSTDCGKANKPPCKVCRHECTRGEPNACGGCGSSKVCVDVPRDDAGVVRSACLAGRKEGELCAGANCAN